MTHLPDFRDALVFTGGGTGGHYFPAVALAEGARRRWPGRPIVFVGATRGIEAKRLPGSSWPHLLLDVEGFMGRSPVSALLAGWKLWRARKTLMALWQLDRPAVVIATGGYGSGPAVLAAKALGIPYFLHESNAQPGLLVKQLSRRARRVWCGMEAAQEHLSGSDCRFVGTPVRESFLRTFRSPAELQPPLRILVLGGSGGARAINEAVMEAAPALLDKYPDWEIFHQTGARDYPYLESRLRHDRHRIQPFLEDMDREMEASSLVVSRSGASTCAELMVTGRPAILVPMPGSAGDHQSMNALAMVAGGRGVYLIQKGDLAGSLGNELSRLMADGALRASLSSPVPNRAVERCLDDAAEVLKC